VSWDDGKSQEGREYDERVFGLSLLDTWTLDLLAGISMAGLVWWVDLEDRKYGESREKVESLSD